MKALISFTLSMLTLGDPAKFIEFKMKTLAKQEY